MMAGSALIMTWGSVNFASPRSELHSRCTVLRLGEAYASRADRTSMWSRQAAGIGWMPSFSTRSPHIWLSYFSRKLRDIRCSSDIHLFFLLGHSAQYRGMPAVCVVLAGTVN